MPNTSDSQSASSFLQLIGIWEAERTRSRERGVLQKFFVVRELAFRSYREFGAKLSQVLLTIFSKGSHAGHENAQVELSEGISRRALWCHLCNMQSVKILFASSSQDCHNGPTAKLRCTNRANGWGALSIVHMEHLYPLSCISY